MWPQPIFCTCFNRSPKKTDSYIFFVDICSLSRQCISFHIFVNSLIDQSANDITTVLDPGIIGQWHNWPPFAWNSSAWRKCALTRHFIAKTPFAWKSAWRECAREILLRNAWQGFWSPTFCNVLPQHYFVKNCPRATQTYSRHIKMFFLHLVA